MLDYVPSPYRVYFYVGVVIILMGAGGAAGWIVNGWRMSGQIEAGKVEAVRLTGMLAQQDQAIAQMAKDAELSAKQALQASAEAAKLRKLAKAKASAAMTMPASSCADVLRDTWGRL